MRTLALREQVSCQPPRAECLRTPSECGHLHEAWGNWSAVGCPAPEDPMTATERITMATRGLYRFIVVPDLTPGRLSRGSRSSDRF